ncbi:MAG: B12-binding domain-containing protein [Eubacteriales bacterium]
MSSIYDEFVQYFEEENKEKAVAFVLRKLADKEIDVLTLYTDILTPAFYGLDCKLADKRICIWKEHVKTAIARTIVECCYPYVIEKRESIGCPKKGQAVVLCPPEEYHELGARIVSDMLTICGYDSIFVGSNTPYNDFFNAIDIIRPKVIAISVSNYYNLVVTKKIIEGLKGAIDFPVKIIVGGNAFNDDPDKYKLVGADYYARTFEQIAAIVGCEGSI